MELDLYPHQRKALGELANGKILRGGVGSGKTKVAAKYYEKREAPKDVYVITTAKKRDSFDWQEEFYRLNIGPKSGPSTPMEPRSGSGSGSDQGRRGHGRSEADLRRDSPDDRGRNDHAKHRSKDDGDNGAGSSSGLGTEEDSGQSPDRRNDGTRLAGSSGDERRHDPESASTSELLAGGGYPDVSGGRGFGQSSHAGEIGDRGSYPYVLTVDSWNNIGKYADVTGAFFIFDEQRLVGSGDWSAKFLKIAKNNNWILLTATPGDTWMDYVPVFVANNFYKNRTAFKREHVVYNTFTKFPKVDRYIGVGKLLRNRQLLLVDMPFDRHTKRRVVEVPLRYDRDALELVLKKRWNIYENRPLRDVAEMFMVGRRLVNSDPSRLEMVKELWTKHPRLIVFYNFNYELHSLRNLLTFRPGSIGSSESTFLTGQKTLTQIDSNKSESAFGLTRLSEPTTSIAEWNGHKHEAIPSTKRWLYLVQYTAGAEGWNCIETDAMIMHSRHYSWKVTEQARGRIDRMNTPFDDLWYYDFTTDSFIDRAIGRALRAKKTFNENTYKSLFES